MADDLFAVRNAPYVRSGPDYNTQLAPDEEQQFQGWLKQNNVPFDASAPVTDYDMRGFYRGLKSGNPIAASAIDPNDSRMHYPDFWKTPLHETFSNESQWATPDAPAWNDQDQLVDKNGRVIFDDRAQPQPQPKLEPVSHDPLDSYSLHPVEGDPFAPQ